MSVDEKREAGSTAIERREVLAGEVEPVRVPPPTDPDVLRREIRETRDDLADALSSLAEKTKLKSRVSSSKARVAEGVKARKTTIGVSAAGLAALVAAGVVAVVAVKRQGVQPTPLRQLQARAQDATAKAYEAQARLRDAESKALKKARDKAKAAQEKARKSRVKATKITTSRRGDLRLWVDRGR
jgi:Protein of unknown function (DUF3618)